METVHVRLRIRKREDSAEMAEEDFVLDTGIPYAIAPEKLVRGLGIAPTGEERFFAGDDTHVRQTGDAYFELGERSGCSKVVFGQEGDMNLVGVRTLEALGLFLHPFTRELMPLVATTAP